MPANGRWDLTWHLKGLLVGTFFLLCYSSDTSQERTVSEVGFLFDFQ